VPLYAVYALLFADTGLSEAKISMLFVLWSTTAIVAEVPSGALADRFSRRAALIASSLFQAVGFLLWIVLPGFVSFAAGFILWGFGGALVTGAYEALLYEGLVERGAEQHYARINGWVNSLALLCQIPAAGAAALLLTVGGYELVGWISIGICLAASLLATRLPEPARIRDEDADGPSYFNVLRAGIREATTSPVVRAAVVAAALIGGLDGLEEYFPLMAKDWGVPTAVVPLAVLGLPLAGAAGSAWSGRADRLGVRDLSSVMFGALALLGAMALIALPAGLLGVAAFYCLHQMVLVVVDARVQGRIEGPSRATVTSVASLGTEIVAIALFAAWAVQGLLLVVGIWLLVALALPLWLKERGV
jgi:MFS family permease